MGRSSSGKGHFWQILTALGSLEHLLQLVFLLMKALGKCDVSAKCFRSDGSQAGGMLGSCIQGKSKTGHMHQVAVNQRPRHAELAGSCQSVVDWFRERCYKLRPQQLLYAKACSETEKHACGCSEARSAWSTIQARPLQLDTGQAEEH